MNTSMLTEVLKTCIDDLTFVAEGLAVFDFAQALVA